jgi:hypothetical protein
MNKEFIPYEQALELEELGFDEPCIATIDQTEFIHIKGTEYPIRGDMWYNTIDAPLYQQAFRWFREKGIESEIHSDFDRMLGYNRGYIPVVQFIEFYNNGDSYQTYEEAEIACLKKLIEIIKNK